MASKKADSAAWREQFARAGSYRAAFRFEPERIKHPSAGWVAMFKQEFGMTDADFAVPRSQGDEPVVLDSRPALAPEHHASVINTASWYVTKTTDEVIAQFGALLGQVSVAGPPRAG